jgi:hypothetical protein
MARAQASRGGKGGSTAAKKAVLRKAFGAGSVAKAPEKIKKAPKKPSYRRPNG